MSTPAPGARVIVRDAEWLVRSIKRASSGAQVFEAVGISDFIKGTDKIILSKTSFNALVSTPGNSLQAAEFATINEAANELALVGSSNAKIVYNLATGNLFYNQNGATTGLGNGALFANFNGIPQLSENDILIQA